MLKKLALIVLTTFVTLKLSGVVTWSWWVVLAPLWLPAVILLATISAIVTLLTIVSIKLDE